MVPKITLKQLTYFLAAAEEENFRSAAERMHVSQPPLSKQIRLLEEALGVELFRREGGRVRLTQAGMQLRDSGPNVLDQLRRAVDDTRRAAAGGAGRLTIGFTDDYFLSGLAESISTYQSRYPEVVVGSHVGLTARLARETAHRDIDIAFVCPPLPPFVGELTVRHLKPTHIHALVPATHRLTDRESIDLAELKEEAFVMEPRMRATGYFTRLGMMFDDAGFSPKIVHECEGTPMTVNLVAAGLGVALIGEHTMLAPDNRVVILAVSGIESTVRRAAIWRTDNHSPRLENFLDIAIAATD